MKIQKIVIENFKGIEFTTFIPKEEPIWLFDKNGSGKTSFLEALRYGLTGKMPKDILYHGADEGFVTILFNDPDNTTVTRYFYSGARPNKVKVNSKTCTAKEAQKIICEIMNASDEKLDVLTSNEVFQELIKGDLGKFLLSFITEPMTIEKLYEICEFTDDEKAKIADDKLLPKKFDVSITDSVYQVLFAERASLKKQVASLQAKYDFEEPLPEPKYKSEADVKKAEDEYIKLSGEAAFEKEKLDAYNKALTEYNSRKARQETLKRKLDELVAKLEVETTESDVDNVNKTLNDAVTMKHNFETIIASNKVVVNNQKKILDALDSDKCPISSCLICKTDKTKAKADVEESISAAQSAVDTASEGVTKESEIIKEANNRLSYLRTQLNITNEIKALKCRISDIDVGEEPSKPTIVTISGDWKLFPVYKKEYEEYYDFVSAKELLGALIKKTAIVDGLVKKFSPKGDVRVAIMKHYCDLFDTEAEMIANAFDYQVKFRPENGVKLSIVPAGKTAEVDFTSLSTGEKLIVSIIIYVVLNNLMGTDIIILDDFNDLDAENAAHAKDIVQAVYRDLGITTIFVAGCAV